MSKRSLFLLLFIFYTYVTIIQCNELPPCYNQPAESCPLQNKCKCVKTGDSALFCCQVQSNEDLIKNFECSGIRIKQIITTYLHNFYALKLKLIYFVKYSFELFYINYLRL